MPRLNRFLTIFYVCLTVHHQYNDVSKQQDATTFSFINLFKSDLQVSGEKFVNLQELYIQILVHCTKRCIYSQKVLLKIGEFVARNIQGDLKD